MANTSASQQREERTLARAQRILDSRWKGRVQLLSRGQVQLHFALRMHGLEREVFDAAFLDARHGLIATERLFTGTLCSAEVHPREVVRRAMHHNAASVIVAHNHPSGFASPSMADKQITERLREALALVDVTLLDHIIIGGMQAYSFAGHETETR